MKKNLVFISFCAAALFFNSCTVEKRVHRGGYNVEFHVFNKNTKPSQKSKETLVASNEVKTEKQSQTLIENSNQNTLIQENNELKLEANLNNLNNQNNVEYLVVPNPTEEKVVDSKQAEKSNEANVILEAKNSDLNSDSDSKENITKSAESNNVDKKKGKSKDRVVAILLWFFLGGLGIHRFYLGYTGLGILYLLTGACFGIGWIVDGILFLTGRLEPKNGRYSK